MACGKPPRGGDDYYFRDLYKISKNNVKYEFTNGLNIIIGPNGCGKTTLIDILAKKMSIVNPEDVFQKILKNLSTFYNFKNSEKKGIYEDYIKKTYVGGGHSLDVNMEYSNVLTYLLNRKSFDHKKEFDKLIATGASKSSFGASAIESLRKSQISYSNGESSVSKIMQFIDLSSSKCKFTYEMMKSRDTDFGILSEKTYKLMEDWQNRHASDQKPTILIDEMDEGMDFFNQIIYWEEVIPKLVEKYQVIMVTHSLMAFSDKIKKTCEPNFINFFKNKEIDFIRKSISWFH